LAFVLRGEFFTENLVCGCDVRGRFSSVEELCEDDAFAESMLGSQGNKEELERFAAVIRSGYEGKEWLSHL
jgi:hypothetical protein